MSLLFAGVALCPEGVDGELIRWVEENIALKHVFPMDRYSWRGDAGAGKQGPECPVQPYVLHWPVGASRWAHFHAIVSEAQLVAIRAAADSARSGVLEMSWYDNKVILVDEITTTLTMLPAKPLNQLVLGTSSVVGNISEGMYLLTLVDDRYFWWLQTSGVLATSVSEMTFPAVITALALQLGITITSSTVADPYVLPAIPLVDFREYTPEALDTAAFYVGHRLTRSLAGAVKTRTPAAAAADVADNIARAADLSKRAGGKFSATDVVKSLPAALRVVFPRNDGSLVYISDSVAIADGKQRGRYLHHPLKADYKTASPPANKATIDLLVAQMATDYVAWSQMYYDVKFHGIVKFNPDAFHDIEWTYREGEISSRLIPFQYETLVLPGCCEEKLPAKITARGGKGLTTLAAPPMDAITTTMYVSSASGFPATVPYRICIEGEHMLVIAGAGTTIWTVVRARDGSTAIAHSVGEEIIQVGTPYAWSEVYEAPAGGWEVKPSGQSGTVAVNPAYERNENSDVRIGTIVWLHIGSINIWSTNERIFDYCCEDIVAKLTTIVVANPTELASPVDNIYGFITVTSAGNFPTTCRYRIKIDKEVMIVTAGMGTTTWTVTRGAHGTNATSHAANAVVEQYGAIAEWREMEEAAVGNWVTKSGGMTGVKEFYPAYERNGNNDVPEGIILKIWREYLNPDCSQEWIFDYCCSETEDTEYVVLDSDKDNYQLPKKPRVIFYTSVDRTISGFQYVPNRLVEIVVVGGGCVKYPNESSSSSSSNRIRTPTSETWTQHSNEIVTFKYIVQNSGGTVIVNRWLLERQRPYSGVVEYTTSPQTVSLAHHMKNVVWKGSGTLVLNEPAGGLPRGIRFGVRNASSSQDSIVEYTRQPSGVKDDIPQHWGYEIFVPNCEDAGNVAWANTGTTLFGVRKITSNYTLQRADWNRMVECEASANVTITLFSPDAVTHPGDAYFAFCVRNLGTATLFVAPPGALHLNNRNEAISIFPCQSCWIYCDGTEWYTEPGRACAGLKEIATSPYTFLPTDHGKMLVWTGAGTLVLNEPAALHPRGFRCAVRNAGSTQASMIEYTRVGGAKDDIPLNWAYDLYVPDTMDAGSTVWAETGMTLHGVREIRSATNTLLRSDWNRCVEYEGGEATLNLFDLDVATHPGDALFAFCVRNLGTGTLTVTPAGTETIDNTTSKRIDPCQGCWIFSNGTEWYTVPGLACAQTGSGTPTHAAPAGTTYVDTTNFSLYANYDGTNWRYIGTNDMLSAKIFTPVARTGTVTISGNGYWNTLGGTGPWTLTLPSPSTTGIFIGLEALKTLTGIVYIATPSGTIIGPNLGTPRTMVAGETMVVQANGTDWRVIFETLKPIDFQATRTTTQSINSASATKVQFNSETWDIGANYDPTTNFRHTPLAPGIYRYAAEVGLTALADGSYGALYLYKNGALYKTLDRKTNGGAQDIVLTGTAKVSMNGTTDYAEIFVEHNHGSARNTIAASTVMNFEGERLCREES